VQQAFWATYPPSGSGHKEVDSEANEIIPPESESVKVACEDLLKELAKIRAADKSKWHHGCTFTVGT
jgi:hypothetical protein